METKNSQSFAIWVRIKLTFLRRERDWVLGEFKAGRSPILIATDVASRGLGTFLLFPQALRSGLRACEREQLQGLAVIFPTCCSSLPPTGHAEATSIHVGFKWACPTTRTNTWQVWGTRSRFAVLSAVVSCPQKRLYPFCCLFIDVVCASCPFNWFSVVAFLPMT